MKSSEILREAQKLIVSKRQCFICFAINSVHFAEAHKKVRLIIWIAEMLRKDLSLSHWLFTQHGIKLDSQQYRIHRIQWLDQLIAICESEGD